MTSFSITITIAVEVIEAIDHLKTIRDKRVDINVIVEYANENTASNIIKNAIENFILQLTNQKVFHK